MDIFLFFRQTNVEPIIIFIKSLVIVLDAQIAFLFFSLSHPVVIAGLSKPVEKIAGPVGVV